MGLALTLAQDNYAGAARFKCGKPARIFVDPKPAQSSPVRTVTKLLIAALGGTLAVACSSGADGDGAPAAVGNGGSGGSVGQTTQMTNHPTVGGSAGTSTNGTGGQMGGAGGGAGQSGTSDIGHDPTAARAVSTAGPLAT